MTNTVRPLVWTALSAGLALVVVLQLCLGEYQIALVDVVKIMAGQQIPGQKAASYILLENRLPRVLLGALCGIALSLAGGIFQQVLHNPLASPDVLGINSCAAAAVTFALAFFGVSTSGAMLAALLGGIGGAILIVLVSQGRDAGRISAGASSTFNLVLAGVAIAALAVAITQFFLSRLNIYAAGDAAIWLTGSLRASNWQRVYFGLAVVLSATLLLVLLRRGLAMLVVGEQLAFALGVPVPALRWGLLALATLLAASATALAGPITFVAFLCAPTARALTGGRHHLGLTALIGVLLVLGADFIAANLLPATLPVGVATGLLGGPALLAAVVRQTKRGTP